MPRPFITVATRLLLVAGLATATLAARHWNAVNAADADDTAVRAVLNAYFAGQSTGDGSHYRPIFNGTSNLYGIREGTYIERTSAEFIAGSNGKPAPDEAQRKREIVFVDRAGDAASAKLVTTFPGGRTTDYMSLLKVDGTWKIVAKTFIIERTTR